MAKELRQVPPNWNHPSEWVINRVTQETELAYIPLLDEPYIDAITKWIADHQAWERGDHSELKKPGVTKEKYPYFATWGGDAPEFGHYRPNWKPEDATWWQVYENVSMGTPVTPPLLAAQNFSRFESTTVTSRSAIN